MVVSSGRPKNRAANGATTMAIPTSDPDTSRASVSAASLRRRSRVRNTRASATPRSVTTSAYVMNTRASPTTPKSRGVRSRASTTVVIRTRVFPRR